MSPRAGGEADKLGNRYELAWAIRHALYCLSRDGVALTLEDSEFELRQSSEFTYEAEDFIEVHQVKRQNGNRNSWNINTLDDMKIFEAAKNHVAQGRHYHFVSLTPCRQIQELSDRARRSADLANFIDNWLSEEQLRYFDQLAASNSFGSQQEVWDTLRGMQFSVHDESDIITVNGMLAECYLSGAGGKLMSFALGDILLDNLGSRLTRQELLVLLAQHNIQPLTRTEHQQANEQVRAVTDSWRRSVQRELLQPPIERSAAEELVEKVKASEIGFITGAAGSGKSAVLQQAIAMLEATEIEVLALRLDRLEPFASTIELGRQLGFETSPVVALKRASGKRASCLVIDQLDAVSLASGRIPASFDIVVDLIEEALSAGTRVVLACRQFDIDNDHRIRSLASRSDVGNVDIRLLKSEDVTAAVVRMGLNPTDLTATQRDILKTPLHLVLLQSISSQPDALTFNSRGSLFDAFWERKRQAACVRREGVKFGDVVSRIANAASDRQTLSVPIEILDEGDLIEHAKVLVSEQVLAQDNRRITFFHEMFFDYAFARLWASRGERIIDFLLRDEQLLFRRAQVRQILQHLYEREPDRFYCEVEETLASEGVRFHIKETVLAVLGSLSEPTTADAEIALRMATMHPHLEDLLWQQLCRPQWFARFNEEGEVSIWLGGEDSNMRDRALKMMAIAVRNHTAAVTALLTTFRAYAGWPDWVRSVTLTADIWQNRQLFDLVLEAVREGAYDEAENELWVGAEKLGEHQPLWAIELLQARWISHADSLTLNEAGIVSALKKRDIFVTRLIDAASDAEPLAFAQIIVPYLQRVVEVTALLKSDYLPILDRCFNLRLEIDKEDILDIGEALLMASVRSLEKLAKNAPEQIRDLLSDLASHPYDTSQFLLYRSLTANGEYFASWAAKLLLEGGSRLYCGYISDPRWVARELAKTIAPYLRDETHKELENLFRDLRNKHEHGQSHGYSAFSFLSALEYSRLTPAGKQRLSEYRRKFKLVEPPRPIGVIAEFIGSPIESAAIKKMTDKQLLKAMKKYDSDKTNLSTLTGGAYELSWVLKEQAAADPVRFAQLALHLTSEFNSAYAGAFLQGLGNAAVRDDARDLIFEAVRHIALLGQAENDRWLGYALRQYYTEVPFDLVELILRRALHSPDPIEKSSADTADSYREENAVDLYMKGINTCRGILAETLGDLIITDSEGQRSALVAPYLSALSNDPSLSVRACVAHTLAASLRHSRSEVLAAFSILINNEDCLLAAEPIKRLIIYIGNMDSDFVVPVIERMLASDNSETREAGGQIAAFAAIEWGLQYLMQQAREGDRHVRKGVARIVAGSVVSSSNTKLAVEVLTCLMNDKSEEVQKEATAMLIHLRNRPLRPFTKLLTELIESPACAHAMLKLLLTLKAAPDEVDNLVLKASQRFLNLYAGMNAGEVVGDPYVSELVVRGLAQCRDRVQRAELLDVLDHLLAVGAWGVNLAIEASERL
ncbi:hypothetical protein EII31_00935 [Leucobacter sp. OH2974_COT-288]|nr:hypothetical protein EII31_00935 [Leucobacter sp. OH2974_COT-288]